MTKRKNRSLDTIADDISKLKRDHIFDVGDLLIEAKEQCEHGQWLDWLDDEFEWSVDTAENYMKVAELASKFRPLRNLKLAKTTLYTLAGSDYDDDTIGAIINELEKHATRTRLKPCDARRIIDIGFGRHHYGDYPDATLFKLADIDWTRGEPFHEKAVTALKERKPETDEAAEAIVDEIVAEQREADRVRREAEQAEMLRNIERSIESDNEAEREAEAILDGPPPELPSITPPEPQKFSASTLWAGTGSFDRAVRDLLDLRTKPAERFVGVFSPTELRAVSEFMIAVAEASKTKAEAV
ncbi:DUF3102 domain-containing protein [Bradyrhizobium sp. CCBAU 051011]|uniref:DUF3102 domain-containing protein n=1 Tax=Bradyrhizobium sp. CCBAU 051011 TaxID=858422 RepID=UPI0013794CC8|nr:DUF3102 domain-containing protein [Bradyrhizobium sp. CCBAU 051011]